ncbi:thioester reductase domain-containing protein [Herpetosiphon giganteus]|uniref:thioester reductase domain-containing protein n=1 Tax=Herpetosiphon giganteus TaxID=2029754 RepID=UPI0019585B15|nr:thioester reductase domain-containing protein [Herpetosiphon giganteus]MBM7845959.1 thioester reductase-like protein [Herpetosiphon giganteus]
MPNSFMHLAEKRVLLTKLLRERLGQALELFDLAAEVNLDPAICPPTQPWIYPEHPATVLLTGATGFLGSHLLISLLQQTTAKLICLVRASDHQAAKNRLAQNIQYYLPEAEIDWSRIEVVIGDLAKPQLGLTPDEWNRLAEQVELIYHNGANVNWSHAYAALYPTNVAGVRSIIALACTTKLKPIQYVSSIVAQFSSQAQTPRLNEDLVITGSEVLALGYPQTKWVAERILQLAATRGVPIAIYRPGLIGGDSRTGVANLDDFLGRMLKGCIELGAFPQGLSAHGMGLAPANYVAAAIVAISQKATTVNQVFHLTNPNPQDNRLLFEYALECGFQLTPLAFDAWLQRLHSRVSTQPEHAFYPLLAFFEGAKTPAEIVPFRLMEQEVDSSNTASALLGTAIVCPAMDKTLVASYFKYFFQSGFLAKPADLA